MTQKFWNVSTLKISNRIFANFGDKKLKMSSFWLLCECLGCLLHSSSRKLHGMGLRKRSMYVKSLQLKSIGHGKWEVISRFCPCPPIWFKMVRIIIQRVVASDSSSECVSPTMSSKFEANLRFNQFKYFAKHA